MSDVVCEICDRITAKQNHVCNVCVDEFTKLRKESKRLEKGIGKIRDEWITIRVYDKLNEIIITDNVRKIIDMFIADIGKVLEVNDSR